MLAAFRVKLLDLLTRAREGFWLIPLVMVLLASALGVSMPWVDAWLETDGDAWRRIPLVYDANPEGARSLLGAIAGSSITVAATVFSITIATLALTSQQFGPRLLRTFIRDRGVQAALGTFLASFTYAMLVLRVVRGGENATFVPHISTTLAIGIALAAVFMLVYFIDHVATMIRAPQIIHAVGAELDAVMDERIPADGWRGDSDEDSDALCLPAPQDLAAQAAACAPYAGYITYIDEGALVTLAAQCDTVLRLPVHVGGYVFEKTPLVLCEAAERFNEQERDALGRAFAIGPHRTQQQDVVYGLNQLVELALRAISPGINDPFTAQSCVDRISAALARVADRPFPDPRRRDDAGKARLLVRRPNFGYLVSISYAPIRRYARGDVALLGRMLEGLREVSRRVPPDRAGRLAALREEAQAIADSAGELDTADRAVLERELQRFNQELNGRLAVGC